MNIQNCRRIIATLALLSISSHSYGLGDSVERMRALWNYAVFDKGESYSGWAFGGRDKYFSLYYLSDDYTPKQFCSIFNADGKEVFEVFSFEGECSATNMPLAKFLKLSKMQTKPREYDGILRWDGLDGMSFAIVSPSNKHLIALVSKEYFDGPLCGDFKLAKAMLENWNADNLPIFIKSLAGVTGNPPETEAEKKAVILAKKDWLNFCTEDTVEAEAVWSIPESRKETLLELNGNRRQAEYKWVGSDDRDTQWLSTKGRWMVVSFEGAGKYRLFLHSFMDFVRDAMSDSTLSEMQGFTMAVTGAELDKFGNITKSVKLVAKISRDTASKINWDGIGYERFEDLLLSDGVVTYK